MTDLAETFFNENEFGEIATLTRGKESFEIKGLYDSPEVPSESVGDVGAIAHVHRLFVRVSDLPESKPRKNDVFTLGSTPFHGHGPVKLRAITFVSEKDGVVVYRLEETK